MTALSIIVPALNEAEGIASMLSGLAPMRCRGAELIVVDGGSTDGTATRAAPFADKVVVTAAGRAVQLNGGAAHASGRVLLFLHADSELPADADRLIVERLGGSGRHWGHFDVRIRGTHPLLRVIAFFMNIRSRVTGIATGDQGIFVTSSVFEHAGHFPEIRLMEDVAFARTLKRYGRPLVLSPRIHTSGRRWQKHGVLRTVFLMWRLRFAYWAGANPDELAMHYADHK